MGRYYWKAFVDGTYTLWLSSTQGKKCKHYCCSFKETLLCVIAPIHRAVLHFQCYHIIGEHFSIAQLHICPRGCIPTTLDKQSKHQLLGFEGSNIWVIISYTFCLRNGLNKNSHLWNRQIYGNDNTKTPVVSRTYPFVSKQLANNQNQRFLKFQ